MTSSESNDKAMYPIRSIVFGDLVKNKYGMFRCFCSAISSVNQIEAIMNYIKQNPTFSKFNKFAYGFRISKIENHQEISIEDFHNDEKLDGVGEKILHLLEKFNVENVLMIAGMNQKDPFSILNPENYHNIIEQCKELLNTLYDKVLETQMIKNNEEHIMKIKNLSYNEDKRKWELKPKTKTLDPLIISNTKQERKELNQNRPGHVFNGEFKKPVGSYNPKIVDKEKLMEGMLRQTLERNTEKLEYLLKTWTDNDYLQYKFLANYDHDPKMEKVFHILMIMENIDRMTELAKNYNFKTRLGDMQNILFTVEKMNKINAIIRSDKDLNTNSLLKINANIAKLFEYILLIIKNYEIHQKLISLSLKNNSNRRKSTTKSIDQFKLYDNSKKLSTLSRSSQRITGIIDVKNNNATNEDINYEQHLNQIQQGQDDFHNNNKNNFHQQQHDDIYIREIENDLQIPKEEKKVNQSDAKLIIDDITKKRINRQYTPDPISTEKKKIIRDFSLDVDKNNNNTVEYTTQKSKEIMQKNTNDYTEKKPSTAKYTNSITKQTKQEESDYEDDGNLERIKQISMNIQDIGKYINENPLENQPIEYLEIFAEKLKEHRIKNFPN